METILNQIKGQITPDYDIFEKVDPIVKKIQDELNNQKINAKVIVGGSVAKGTFLKKEHDCDLFVAFDKSYKNENLSDLLEPVLKKTLIKIERLHGSRDYFQYENSIMFEIVPVINISKPEEALNITDCSPLHAQWVLKYPEKNNEIRLAKAFAKANNVYGAESYINGFSGHVLDILTIHYGSFVELLYAATKWNEGDVVDPNNIHKGNALQTLNESKIKSPLIVIDPIQTNRNAAAALGKEKFELFKHRAKEFLDTPNINFFEKKVVTKKELIEKGMTIIIIKPLEGKNDVIGAKLMKVFKFLAREIKEYGFTLTDAGWQWENDALLWFKAENIEKEYTREGPPLKAKDNVETFIKKYANNFEKDKRVYAIVQRKYISMKDFLNDIIANNYIQEKVKTIEIID